jgi:2',3'-cyclic-nucleotide 2'-phosphodiesterase (5'-nucleotidase family)
MSKSPSSLSALLALALAAALFLGFVSGCDRDKPPRRPSQKEAQPTVRIYALAGAAGAVEPCGCVKDMLGGVDHAAAWIVSQSKQAPASIVLGAGPMFFSDPSFAGTGHEQNLFKAEAMAASLKDLKLVAWAPGANDWAFGVPRFSELVKLSGARSLAANLPAEAGLVSTSTLVVSGGIKVGLTGVSVPEYQSGRVTFKIGDAQKALGVAQAELKRQGAEILVALLSAQRGEALRLIENTPGFHLAIIGKGFDQGELNDQPFTPELIGGTLVTQATNHLQGVSVIDLFVRDGKFEFADGSGLDVLSQRRSLSNQIDALRMRVSELKANKSAKPEDITAQEARVGELEKQIKTLKDPETPSNKSYFLYDLVEVRENAGSHEGVASRLSAYYRQVNEHNRVTFKDKKPRPVAEGEASYVGAEICSNWRNVPFGTSRGTHWRMALWSLVTRNTISTAYRATSPAMKNQAARR